MCAKRKQKLRLRHIWGVGTGGNSTPLWLKGERYEVGKAQPQVAAKLSALNKDQEQPTGNQQYTRSCSRSVDRGGPGTVGGGIVEKMLCSQKDTRRAGEAVRETTCAAVVIKRS